MCLWAKYIVLVHPDICSITYLLNYVYKFTIAAVFACEIFVVYQIATGVHYEAPVIEECEYYTGIDLPLMGDEK